MVDDKQDREIARLGATNWIVLAACALVPPLFATAFTQFEELKMGVASILMGAALLTFGGQVIAGKRVTMTAGKVAIAALVFALYVAASVAWSPVPTWGAVTASGWIAGVAAFLVVLAPGGRALRFEDFSVAVALGAAVSGLFGVLDFAGLGIFTPVWDPVGPAAAFDNLEFALAYYAIALPILVAGVWRNGGIRRIACGIGLALGAFHFGLASTWLTLGIFVGVAAVTTIVVMGLQRFARFPLLLPAMALFALTSIVVMLPLLAIDLEDESNYANELPRVSGRAEALPGPDARLTNFATGRWETLSSSRGIDYAMGVGFALFREQPVFGQGPYGWWTSQTRYPDPDHAFVSGRFNNYPALRTPHNSFMTVLVEYGGAGLLLLLLWLSAVAGITFTALSTKEETEAWLNEHWALSIAILTGVAFALFTPGLDLAASSLIWFVALGLLTRESATLNEFKGLSSPLTLNADGRRYDIVVSLGVLPAIVGLGVMIVSSLALVSNYHRGLGDHLMLRGKYLEVEGHYRSAEKWLAGRGELHYSIALTHKRTTGLTAAADDIDRALELRPDDARVLNLKAYLQLKQRDTEAAAETARKSVARFPNYLEPYRAIAVSQDLLGRPDDAVKTLEEVLERDPPSSERARLHYEIGEYYLGPLKMPAKAAEHLEKARNLADNAAFSGQLRKLLDRAEAQTEMQRMIREGKAVPKELRNRAEPPKENFGGAPGHEGHDH